MVRMRARERNNVYLVRARERNNVYLVTATVVAGEDAKRAISKVAHGVHALVGLLDAAERNRPRAGNPGYTHTHSYFI